MAMEISNYGSYAAQSMAQNSAVYDTKKKETEKAAEKAVAKASDKTESMAEYAQKLAKLVPSVEFKVGNGFASAKNGKTLTVSPALLEKMKNDPGKEKEMKELIKGVESMTRLSKSLNKATGWTTVFRHSYIDENGKYCHIALIRNDFMLNMSDKLREERRKNSEELLEKQRENAEKKKEVLDEQQGEKKEAEKLLEEKMESSKDGMVYMDDVEFKTILEAMKEEGEVNPLTFSKDNAIELSISKEGMESFRKKFHESNLNGASGKVIVKADKGSIIKQASNALIANNYSNELAKETEILMSQRKKGNIYSVSDRAEDYVRAYGNLYDEIVQGYQNGTRERYIEDKTSGTGYRKMSMEEELSRLDKAFQRMADGTDVKEMITNEFKRLSSKAENKQTSFSDTNKKPQTTDDAEETAGQKMKKLAQVWKDTYKTSGSKENSMEKVLSMINGMFGSK